VPSVISICDVKVVGSRTTDTLGVGESHFVSMVIIVTVFLRDQAEITNGHRHSKIIEL
jgi:hypothetical protein